MIATQGVGLGVVNETFFLGVKSDPPAKLPADRSGEAGHVTIPDSCGVTDRLLTRLHTIEEVSDVEKWIRASHLAFGLAFEKLRMTRREA